MIISSKITNERWIWVKIPKTGTRAYSQLFNPHPESELHFHYTFHSLYNHHKRQYSGFTVTRHPRTRFISALKHLVSLYQDKCGVPYNNMKHLVEFFYDNFDRNCVPKQNKTLQEIFQENLTQHHVAFFAPQTFWAYHPKVTWFKYENLQQFNRWIETRLGYDTSKLQQIGKVDKNHLAHLDFQHSSFQKVVHHLFQDDFTLFDYPEDV
jgi:hypothetical protein